jgi:enamine deaminase RidA (YjgF/YER057c/UK114 family)
MTGRIDRRLAELGVLLPSPAAPVANYVPFVIAGHLLFVSGQVPFEDGKIAVAGKVGDTVSLEEAKRAARICAINILAQAKVALGDLDRIRRCVKLGGFVASGPGFTQHPAVINGASDLMVEVLGDGGRHARFAVGAPALPLDAAVEVDAVFEIAP